MQFPCSFHAAFLQHRIGPLGGAFGNWVSKSVLHLRAGAGLMFLAGLVPSGPVLAGTFVPPEGCTGYATVQMKACTVSNHYTCEGDAPGDKWRADFGQNGLFFMSRIDSEAQWIESINLNPTVSEFLEPGAPDRASFSELLAKSEDTYNFSTKDENGVRETVTGFDRLTGQTVVIDGVTLQQTQFDATATFDDGTLSWHSAGNEFIHPEWRLFLSGRGQWDGGDGEKLPYDSTPVTFTFPGDSGFFSTQPLFGCDSMMSRAAPGTRPGFVPDKSML